MQYEIDNALNYIRYINVVFFVALRSSRIQILVCNIINHCAIVYK